MHNVTKQTLVNAYKPFDVVSNERGDVGYIREVNVNDCQPNPVDQISYAVTWLVGNETKSAWWDHQELTYHCNLFVEIAKNTCSSFSTSGRRVQELFNSMER